MNASSVDIINAHIVTVDADWNEFPQGFMSVREGRITALGSMGSFSPSSVSIVDVEGAFVFPGLINTHTHSFQTLTRGLGEGLGVWEWFSQAIDRVVGHLTPDDAHLAGAVTAMEAVRCGTTTVLDYNYPHPVAGMAEATIAGMRSVGVRTVLARGILDAGAVHADIIHSTSDEIDSCAALARQFHHADDDRIRVWFAPYTVFSASPEALVAARDLAVTFASGVTIHATTPSTLEESHRLFGTSDIAYEESIGVLGPRTLLVHCTHPENADLDAIAHAQASVSHNPVSNAYLGEGVAPIVSMRSRGINVCLGSDGPASNNNQDMLQVMKATALLQKLEHRDPSVILAREVVEMATMGGARALDWADDIGSLEVGKSADFFVLDPWLPNSTSHTDPYATLVFSATAENVVSVYVGGTEVLHGRQLTQVDMRSILRRAQDASMALLERSGLR
jgi:5-methylthioadenosine/S-adenosylhomocysteine deaminase